MKKRLIVLETVLHIVKALQSAYATEIAEAVAEAIK